MRKFRCSNPSRNRPKLVKQIVTAPLLNARQHVCHGSSDIINRMPYVTVGVARTLTAQWPWVPSVGQNLQPLTGNGEVSMSENLSIGIKNFLLLIFLSQNTNFHLKETWHKKCSIFMQCPYHSDIQFSHRVCSTSIHLTAIAITLCLIGNGRCDVILEERHFSKCVVTEHRYARYFNRRDTCTINLSYLWSNTKSFPKY